MSAIATPVPPGVDPNEFVFRVNGVDVYRPFPKQVAYHLCQAPYPLFGGSKGSGKSIAIRFDNYGPCLAVPGMKCLILRRLKLELQRSHLRFVRAEAQKIGAIWKPSDVGAGVMHFPNGSLIEFGHCQHENDIEQYLSAEFDRVSFDEIVTFLELMYLQISTSCRTTIPGLVPRVGGGTNPVTRKKSGGYWVKRRWILKDVTLDEDETYDPDHYEYIPALPQDNPYLNWEQYQRELSRLPPSLRAAYRDGDWDASEDGFFIEFRKVTRHLPDPVTGLERAYEPHVLEFPDFGPSVPRYCGLDWGYMTDEGVCLWGVYGDDGHLYIEDEYVFNGKRLDKLIAKEVAANIVARNRRRGIDVRRTYCDPSMGEQRGHESVETLMDTFGKHGVWCVKGERDRENGWARLRAWLREHPDGTPFLRVHPRCTYLTRTFPEVAVDDKNDNDLNTDGPDHALDALRYLVAGRAAPLGEPVRTSFPPGTVGHLRQQIEAQDARRPVLGAGNVRGRRYR